MKCPVHPLFFILWGSLVLLAGGCGEGREESSVQDDLARAKTAAAFIPGSQQNLQAAREAITPLVERARPQAEDLIRAAIVAYALLEDDEASRLANLALRLAPSDPAVHYVLGNLALRHFEPEEAEREFQKVLAIDPTDSPARLQLGQTLQDQDRFEEAIEHFRQVRDAGLQSNATFYGIASYRLGQLLIRTAQTPEQRAEGIAIINEHKALKEDGSLPNDAGNVVEVSNYGRVLPPPPRPIPPGPASAAALALEDRGSLTDFPEGHTLRVADFDSDGDDDLLGFGPSGLVIFLQDGSGMFSSTTVTTRPVLAVAFGDLDDSDPESDDYHPALELLVIKKMLPDATDGGHAALYTYWPDTKTFRWMTNQGYNAENIMDGLFVDYDHDGDLDVVLLSEYSIQLRRNDGATDPRFRDLTKVQHSILRPFASARSLHAEDLDGDQDVDLIAVGSRGVEVYSNLRAGLFEDVSQAWGIAGLPVPTGPGALLIEDLDLDGRPDFLIGSEGALSFVRNLGGRFAIPPGLDLSEPFGTGDWDLDAADLDGDGQVDLLARRGGETRILRGPLGGRDGPLPSPLAWAGSSIDESTALGDFDRDGEIDILRLREGNLRRFSAEPSDHRSVTLQLQGRKDNTHGKGSVIEMRSGPLYRRVFSDGSPVTLGLGSGDQIDVLFVRWPNGVLQRAFDLPAGQVHTITQVEGLVGSCPFLYAWDGETYGFVTDVLGNTPLGLPMAPGQMVPFDHEEYVKIRADQLVPRDGHLDIVLTEELREVTYLDRVRLHAIDHPSEVEIQPNEGFVFPPFPPHHIHRFSDIAVPAVVTASTGEDLSDLLSNVDGRIARSFIDRPAQFYGLAEPWHLDVDFGVTPDQLRQIADAPRLRLALTGWVLWTDASVNVAAARHPEISFEPPSLWIPDGSQGWKQAGRPIGFPAGKTKTLIVDVTDILDRQDPRLRIATTMAICWDAVRLVLDNDEAPLRDTSLQPDAAHLAYRGFSRRLVDPSGKLPEQFRWTAQDLPRWDQHPGNYTRYGSVTELLHDNDDQSVIFGSGDALYLSFAEHRLPPLPQGWTRDWLLYLDGWAKDGDPNTVGAEKVEPLPFHAMGTYPPLGPFPDSAEHRRWKAEYNTRPGRRLIEDLQPESALITRDS